MNENESKILLAKYLEMPEEELVEMLMEPESEYREGIYPLLLDAAKSRGLGVGKREIVDKASSLHYEIKRKIIEQPLTPKQRKMFTLFPGLAFWYSVFAPHEWEQRKKEALRCQLIGSRNYLLIGFILVVAILLLSNEAVSSDEILLVLFLSVLICGLSLYLFYLKRKHPETYNKANSADAKNRALISSIRRRRPNQSKEVRYV